MKRFSTNTRFVPLTFNKELGKFEHIRLKDGKAKDFKSRKAVESYCKKHRCIYCEEKYIFYK